MTLTIAPFTDGDDTAIEQAYEIDTAAMNLDVPDLPCCRQRFFAKIQHPMPGNVAVHLLAHLDGAPAGYLALDLPQLENTENASVSLVVHPAYRRRGVGRALFEHGVGALREWGRVRVSAVSPAHLPGQPDRPAPAVAFAAVVGAANALVDVRRRLDVRQLDQDRLDSLLAEARVRSAGYELLFWQDGTPDEYITDVAYLDGRLLADAPMGDLAWEPQQVDAERVRDTDRVFQARGRRRYHTGVRHQETGRLVAWTCLDTSPATDWHAFQQITIVDPRHRGHRLGLLTKIENLRYLLSHEPTVQAIDTFNAESNDHMIAINDQLGFRARERWDNWQFDL